MAAFDHFPKEVLKAQDGKQVPLKMGNGGPVIGQATFRYEEDTGRLLFDACFDNEQVGAWLRDEVDHPEERES